MSAVDKPGLFGRALAWLRGDTPPRLPMPTTERAPDEPVHLQPEEESWLAALVSDVAEGRRAEEIGSEPFWERIDAMWSQGHERLAIQWLDKFIAAPSTPEGVRVELRARLVELLERRGDLAEGVAHLEVLAEIPAHAVRAQYLLGEHFRRRGDEARALRHYEAVLARDVDYPNVRGRVERLRLTRGRHAAPDMGETIAGVDAVGAQGGARYRLVRELGRGATGVVYLARDTELERDVAVKLLHPHLGAMRSAEACARFFDEARVAASLRHPNIVAILDLDERARRLVMELAAGGTLRHVLRDRGPRSLRRALERHSQILSALEAAHRRGIVHRDLKPANLMFRRDPDAPGTEIVLGDFGVAHLPDAKGATGADAVRERKPAEAVGTLAYMAPEARRGAEAAPSTDLYAAAVVLFEMLTGRHPWPRDVLMSGVRRVGDMALPPELRAGVSSELIARVQAHLDRLGHPDASQRPTTDEALAEAQELRDLALAQAS